MRRLLLLAAAAVPVLLACGTHPKKKAPAVVERPARVVLIVVDQLRPDLIDRAPMPRLQAFRDAGASFPNAYVGHLGSKTVVSHAVIAHGLLPRRFGWSDDLTRDVSGVLGHAGAIWDTGGLSLAQFQKLMPSNVPSFARAFAAHPRRASIGQKDYAAYVMAGHDADIVVTLSGNGDDGWVSPIGKDVPSYIVDDERFRLDGRPAFGTETSAYSLGGTKFWKGADAKHPGGDSWVVDAALAVMEREDWGALFVTLGGVDRVGHMMGNDRDFTHPNGSDVTFRAALAEADLQIGRILDALDAKGLDRETLVIVTADHGGMFVEDLRARGRAGKAGLDWNWGKFANGERLDPQKEVAELVAGGGVAATSTDTAFRVWTIPGDPAAATVADRVTKLPGVISVWKRSGTKYQETFRDLSRLSNAERVWQKNHIPELVATAASDSSADVLALLDERTGYAVRGDHGGTQRQVQFVPILFRGPGVKSGKHVAKARLVDIAPTVWALAAQDPPAALDGAPLCKAVVSSPACR